MLQVAGVLLCLMTTVAQPRQLPRSVDCLVERGYTLVEVSGFAQAVGAITDWSETHGSVQLKKEQRSVAYGLGCYVAATPLGLDYPGVAPVRRDGRLFIPLRHAAGCLAATIGGTSDQPELIVGSDTFSLTHIAPTSNSTDALGWFLTRLDDAPVVLSSLETPALSGELQHQLSTMASTSLKPMVPTLTKLSDSKILKLMGHVPGIGEFIEIGRLSLGASEELVGLLDWMNGFDEKYAAPVRRAILACAHVQRTRNLADVPAAVRSLHVLDPALQKYIETGTKAEHTFDKLALLRLRFMLASKKNESLAQFADAFSMADDQLKGGKQIVQALVLQVRDIREYAVQTEADGRKAMR